MPFPIVPCMDRIWGPIETTKYKHLLPWDIVVDNPISILFQKSTLCHTLSLMLSRVFFFCCFLLKKFLMIWKLYIDILHVLGLSSQTDKPQLNSFLQKLIISDSKPTTARARTFSSFYSFLYHCERNDIIIVFRDKFLIICSSFAIVEDVVTIW